MSYGHPCAEHAVWNPKFCVVTDYQMLLLDKEEVLCSQTQRGPFLIFLHMPLQLLELWNFLGIMEFTYITGNLMKWTVLNTGGNRV